MELDGGIGINAARTLALMPGTSFGPFRLGASIITIAETLRAEASRFGNVEVECDVEHPVGKSLTLKLAKIATVLRFTPRTQVLESIAVQQLHQCGEILYKGKVFCSGRAMPATFARIYDVLGPTFEGEMRRDGCYVLQYPGIRIGFDIPTKYHEEFGGGSGGGAHPMVFSDGTTPVATFLEVVSAAGAAHAQPMQGVASVDSSVNVVATPRGATFGEGRLLRFGCSPQDAIALLGTPRGMCAKRDDRLLIHNPSANTAPRPAYFLVFPHLGVDLCFDGISHTLEKIIMFNSVPPDEAFLRYHRCHFAVDASMMISEVLTTDLVITGNTQWSAVEEALTNSRVRIPKPLLATTRNGVVRIFSFIGVVVDVLPTGVVGKVTLWNPRGSTRGAPGPSTGGPGRCQSPVSKDVSPAATVDRHSADAMLGGAVARSAAGASPVSEGASPPPATPPSSSDPESRSSRSTPLMPPVTYPAPSAFHELANAADAVVASAGTSPMRVQHTNEPEAHAATTSTAAHTTNDDDGCGWDATPPTVSDGSGALRADDEAADNTSAAQAPRSRHGFFCVETTGDDGLDMEASSPPPHVDPVEGDVSDEYLWSAAAQPPPRAPVHTGDSDVVFEEGGDNGAAADRFETQPAQRAGGGGNNTVWSTISNSGSSVKSSAASSKKSGGKKGKKR